MKPLKCDICGVEIEPDSTTCPTICDHCEQEGYLPAEYHEPDYDIDDDDSDGFEPMEPDCE
jgi:predicted Zn-ribbon and HTH transcriptional regulator